MKLVLSSVIVALLAFAPTLEDKGQRALEHGRECCKLLYARDGKAIWSRFGDEMRKAVGSEEKLQGFTEQVKAQVGNEVSIVDETTTVQGAVVVYVRKAHFEKLPVAIEVMFSFDNDDKISGFLVRPAPTEAASEFLEYKTKTKLRLPFDGEWFVFWGGRTLAQNYHAATQDQRFAYDIMIMKDGSSHTGDGKKNEDYYCFGRPVLAPAAGVVSVALDGIDDNVPGAMNPKAAAGNHVILDHGNGEYSLLAHFQKGSLKVKPGDKVETGTQLGLCGNSGNSSEPHLHYHLQNTPEFHKGQGLPAQFENYTADGAPVERGEPVKGQRIQNR